MTFNHGFTLSSGISTIELDDEDIEYLASKYKGKLREEQDANMKELISDYNL